MTPLLYVEILVRQISWTSYGTTVQVYMCVFCPPMSCTHIQPVCNGGSVIAIVVDTFNEVKEGVAPVQMLLGKVKRDAMGVKNLLTDQVQHSVLTVKVSTTYPGAG